MRPPVLTPSMNKPAIARLERAGETCRNESDFVVVEGARAFHNWLSVVG